MSLEVFVNISQMTVSQMSLTETTDSPQQRQHWLGEQVLNWSGLPVVQIRATVFLQNFFFSTWAAESIARDDRLTHDVEAITGRPATSVRDHVAKHPERFGPNRRPTNASGTR